MPKRRAAEISDSEEEAPFLCDSEPEAPSRKRVKRSGTTVEAKKINRKTTLAKGNTKVKPAAAQASRRRIYKRASPDIEDESEPEEQSEAEREPSSESEDSMSEDEENQGLPDVIDYELDILFCDISPGQKSLEIGHHFGNPLNHFWYCLKKSGLTSTELSPMQEDTLLRRFHIGITELVPVSDLRDPSKEEMVACFPALLNKVRKYRPRIVCFTGLMMADNIQKAINKQFKTPRGTKAPKSQLGMQAFKVVHQGKVKVRETIFYAIPSVQGKVTNIQKEGKAEVFKELRKHLKKIKAGQIQTNDLRDITSM